MAELKPVVYPSYSLNRCNTYKMGKDHFMDCGDVTKPGSKSEKKEKTVFTKEPKPEAPKLPWFGRPTFI